MPPNKTNKNKHPYKQGDFVIITAKAPSDSIVFKRNDFSGSFGLVEQVDEYEKTEDEVLVVTTRYNHLADGYWWEATQVRMATDEEIREKLKELMLRLKSDDTI